MPIRTDKPNLDNFIKKADTEIREEPGRDFSQRDKRFLLRSPFGFWYELEADKPQEGLPVIKVSFLWNKGDANMPGFAQMFRVAEGFYNIQLSMVGALMEQARGMQAYWSNLFGSMTELTQPFRAVFQSGSGGRETRGASADTIVKNPPPTTNMSRTPQGHPRTLKK